MFYTVSQARARLGHLCLLAQDPREAIVLTRHDKPIAAIVSMEEVRRIWSLQNTERSGWYWPLFRVRRHLSGQSAVMQTAHGLVPGKDGKYVTEREAALQMQEIQMTRATERAILKAGGLEPVEGGEITAPPEPERWWRKWVFWRRETGRFPGRRVVDES